MRSWFTRHAASTEHVGAAKGAPHGATDPRNPEEVGGRPALGYEAFVAILAQEVATHLRTAGPTSRLLSDLRLDEVALYRLHATVEDLNPSFRLPDQADVAFTTLGDVYHYYCSMNHEHLEA